ncbi:MAG: hypothetical protein IJP70_00585 [Bacteroidales bacterium]|nr:hypothetical protein [Bacteroidales bacterium]
MKPIRTQIFACRLWLSVVILAAAFGPQLPAYALQQDTIQTEMPETNIKLSSQFQKELYRAFQFEQTPIADTTNSMAMPLDRQQLHEWVGEVAVDIAPQTLFPIPGLDKACDGVYSWRSKNGRYGILNRGDGTSCFTGLDVNALGRYIRPAEIRIRKAQALAATARPLMDKILPVEGLPVLTVADSSVYRSKSWK